MSGFSIIIMLVRIVLILVYSIFTNVKSQFEEFQNHHRWEDVWCFLHTLFQTYNKLTNLRLLLKKHGAAFIL